MALLSDDSELPVQEGLDARWADPFPVDISRLCLGGGWYYVSRLHLSARNTIPGSVSSMPGTATLGNHWATTTTAHLNGGSSRPRSNDTAVWRDLRRLSDLKFVSNALELYYNQCGYYPGGFIESGICPTTHTSISSWGDARSGLTHVLLSSDLGISEVPQDPLPGATYYYGTDAAGDRYVLATKLEGNESAAFSHYTPPSLGGFVVKGLSSCVPPFYCLTY